jgi:3-oxoacyl-[acyl-carrier-protein] synthase-3
MRHEDLYIAGVGSWYPKPVTADEAIETGLWDEAGRRRTGQVSATVAGDDDTQPGMAVRAGKLAVRQSGHAQSDFGVLLHAAVGFNGLDGWNIASYLQHEILAATGCPRRSGSSPTARWPPSSWRRPISPRAPTARPR